MGPRLVSRGNDGKVRDYCRERSGLQWGRDSLVAEISLEMAGVSKEQLGASMGPRLVSRGN